MIGKLISMCTISCWQAMARPSKSYAIGNADLTNCLLVAT